jgi:hypothetical protein
MRLLTLKAILHCDHQTGLVALKARQGFVRIDGIPVLVEDDPVACAIAGCPNVGPAIKPCTTTLPVRQGYSPLLRIAGHRVCLDTVTGLTDGTPPGMVEYRVRAPGQDFVAEIA